MFENVDGRTDGRTDDGRTDGRRTTDAGVTGILIAHLGAFGSGELKIPHCWNSHVVAHLCPISMFNFSFNFYDTCTG